MRVADEINPSKVRCSGAGLDPKGVKQGLPAPFVVDASDAGEALLECTLVDPTGRLCGCCTAFYCSYTSTGVHYDDLQ